MPRQGPATSDSGSGGQSLVKMSHGHVLLCHTVRARCYCTGGGPGGCTAIADFGARLGLLTVSLARFLTSQGQSWCPHPTCEGARALAERPGPAGNLQPCRESRSMSEQLPAKSTPPW